jgi:hypothetical protein
MQIRPDALTIGLIIYSLLLHYFMFTQNLGLTRISINHTHTGIVRQGLCLIFLPHIAKFAVKVLLHPQLL